MLSDFSFAQDTIGFIIEEKIDSDVLRDLGKRIVATLQENKKMSLYLEDMGIQSFTPNSIFIGILFPFRYSRKFSKLALISDRKWIHFIAFWHNLFTPVKVKSYSIAHRLDAMSWIMER